MKILNLYACLGGNRYKWNEVKPDIEVTAVEWDEELARLYQERFPNDKVIVADAHQYLLDHYLEFDFIWSSPPCPTHSRTNHFLKGQGVYRYADMTLYQEIIFLDFYFKGKYCVENVIPYYKPLIPAKKRGRHLYWTNFNLPNNINERPNPKMGVQKNSDSEEIQVKNFSKYHDYDFLKYKEIGGKQRIVKIARNLVDYEAGKTIFELVCNSYKSKSKQIDLFLDN